MPYFAELLVRGGAAGTFLILAIIFLRDGDGRTVTRLGAFFAMAAAGRSLFTDANLFRWALPWNAPLVLLCFGAAAAFWVFAQSLFDDGFRMRLRHYAACAFMLSLGAIIFAGLLRGAPIGFAKRLHEACECILAFLALLAAWRGRTADLVESRRRARLFFVSATGVLMLVVATTEFTTQPRHHPAYLTDLNAVGLLLVAMTLALGVVGIRNRDIFAPAGDQKSSNRSAAGVLVIECTDVGEARLMGRLRQVMENDRAYREDGLTIGRLAARLGSAEHELRRLINGRLGWRNFNAYLNAWRVAEARDALMDPGQTDVPISTIALDAGFQSLGPFNRAFKSSEAATPTEFRQRATGC